MNVSEKTEPRRPRAPIMALALTAIFACSGDAPGLDTRPAERDPGELVQPPSATAPRVLRESAPPDTLQPGQDDEFAIVDGDSVPLDAFPLGDLPAGEPEGGLSVEAIAASYRGHYGEALAAEGSAVRNRIDRELQHEAERRTARDRGFAGWTELVGALSPEQRVRLVDRLDEANVELARDLHGTLEAPERDEPTPEG